MLVEERERKRKEDQCLEAIVMSSPAVGSPQRAVLPPHSLSPTVRAVGVQCSSCEKKERKEEDERNYLL